MPAARRLLHVDMDAFYASVEALDDPALVGRPLIVGGTGARGVVASCSYEARAFGVRSAMPSGRARRLCPTATFVAGRFERYRQISTQLHAIFEHYTPLVEGISLDEAFLDVTGATRLFGPAPAMAWTIKANVASELGLACAVGVAPSKFLAKLASQAAKPGTSLDPSRPGPRPGPGVVEVAAGAELAFLHPMPVHALWGVGPATLARLSRLGVISIGDLATIPLATLEGAVGRAHGRHLHELAHGRDDRPVVADRPVKSIGHEETYAHDRYERSELEAEVVRMADAVAARLRGNGVAGRTITVKVRYGSFHTITRSRTVPRPTDVGPVIAKVAGAILACIDLTPGVRLFGVTASNLIEPGDRAGEQMELTFDGSGTGGSHRRFDPGPGPGPGPDLEAAAARAWDAAGVALSEVRRRFGESAVGPAALLDGVGLHLKRQGDTQWGPAAPEAGTPRGDDG
ncbi:MAG: DNA polymerase IV [Actinomycetota bacterium]|nr:DNA polymerase IV [Actinomycetota bacterium]